MLGVIAKSTPSDEIVEEQIMHSCLNTLEVGYKILGNQIWKYMGDLMLMQMELIDTRFKWKIILSFHLNCALSFIEK